MHHRRAQSADDPESQPRVARRAGEIEVFDDRETGSDREAVLLPSFGRAAEN